MKTFDLLIVDNHNHQDVVRSYTPTFFEEHNYEEIGREIVSAYKQLNRSK